MSRTHLSLARILENGQPEQPAHDHVRLCGCLGGGQLSLEGVPARLDYGLHMQHLDDGGRVRMDAFGVRIDPLKKLGIL